MSGSCRDNLGRLGRGRGESLPRGLSGRGRNLLNQGTRLPSLKSPRDLTLGGVVKRTFTPTIPVRRDKSKDSINEGSTSALPQQRGRGRGHERGRVRTRGGRGGRGQNVVQTQSSLFSEGPSERTGKGRGCSGSSGGGYGGKSEDSFVPKPKVNFNFASKVNAEDEAKRLQDLYKDDFIDDDDGLNDCEKALPVTLPLYQLGLEIKTEDLIKPDIKMECDKVKADELEDSSEKTTVKVKSEPVSDDESSVCENKEIKKEKVLLKEEKDEKKAIAAVHTRPMTSGEILHKLKTSGREDIILIKLPDTLPGYPASKEDVKPTIKQEPGTGLGHISGTTSNQAQEKTKEKSCRETTFANVSEGFVGKIQTMKSGKTRLLLGNATFNLEMGTKVGYLQDLVSLRITDGDPIGTLSTLAHLKHEMVCIPDMDDELLDV